jgi:hypothetical protein
LPTSLLRAPNSIVQINEKIETSGSVATVIGAGYTTFDNTSFVSNAVSLQQGDEVLVRATFSLQCDDQACFVRLAVNSGGVTALSGTELSMNVGLNIGATPSTVPCALAGSYTVASTGSHSFLVQVSAGPGDTVTLLANRRFELLVIRP